MSSFIEGLGVVLVGAVMAVVLLGFSLVLVNPLVKAVCLSKSEPMQKEMKFDFWAGCFVEIDGEFIPLRNYRVNE